jgi:GMP synthase (glutamine-hydrolysing)
VKLANSIVLTMSIHVDPSRHLHPVTADKRPVLIILHGEQSQPGRVGNALCKLGFRLDIRRPRFGDSLPETMDDHAGVVIFGGPMSANDSDDYIKREIDWIGVPLREQRPFFGVCLGAQMLARHFGARVYAHPEGRFEVGYYPIRATAAGLKICPEWPGRVYQWHKEGFDVPASCELLAEGDDFPNQAIRYGNAFGVQFHPDITYAMMYRWVARAAARLETPGMQTRAEHFAHRAVYDYAEAIWLKNFLAHWLANDWSCVGGKRATDIGALAAG